MKRLTVVLMLALATLLPAVHPAIAQDPEVTAGDVVDRETLKAFVLAAKEYANKATTLPQYRALLGEFRAEGTWKQGSIYLFVIAIDGIVVFHAANPDLEGQNLIDLEDSNGVNITQGLIAAAAEGGGYVEYLWDNPAVAGDEETGSPKVSYAIPYSALGQDFLLGSGFYPEPASTAVEGHSWGQLKNRF
jgi:signal transduction histidine kinase